VVWSSAVNLGERLRRDFLWYDAYKKRFGGMAAQLRKPDGLFLAVSLEPALAADKEAAVWLGDFERCVYWTLYQRSRVPFGH